jgi:mannose-1-phosphate guanylyltransferase
MFLWSVENILEQIKMYSTNTYEALHGIENVEDSNLQKLINEKYKGTEAISIDYAVLEKSDDIYVVPSDFGWDDIGSWEALDRYREKDDYGNVLVGNAKTIKGENNLVISSNQKVLVDGLSDIYVIENDGKIIIGHKSNVFNVKNFREIV